MFKDALRQGANDLAREMGYKPVRKNKPRKVLTGMKKLFARVRSALMRLGMTRPQ